MVGLLALMAGLTGTAQAAKYDDDTVIVKFAGAVLLCAGGADAIVVCGGTVSTVHVYSVARPTFPRDTALTAKV